MVLEAWGVIRGRINVGARVPGDNYSTVKQGERRKQGERGGEEESKLKRGRGRKHSMTSCI